MPRVLGYYSATKISGDTLVRLRTELPMRIGADLNHGLEVDNDEHGFSRVDISVYLTPGGEFSVLNHDLEITVFTPDFPAVRQHIERLTELMYGAIKELLPPGLSLDVWVVMVTGAYVDG